ncbi:MAG: TIR domain-containing protein [bacterium]
MGIVIQFVRGPKFNRAGRAPYLHLLKWLSEANEWSISVDREAGDRPEHKASVIQVVEKGYLTRYLASDEDFATLMHYEPLTKVLSVEDPQFMFYLRNLLWTKIAEKAGFAHTGLKSHYDFAISFAGPDRQIAKRLFELLTDRDFVVFYDANEQHRILGEDLEAYLAPIYKSEAQYIICLIGQAYPERVWTKFESDQFKDRFGEGAVIPVFVGSAKPAFYDRVFTTGRFGIGNKEEDDVESQLLTLVELLVQKLQDKSWVIVEQLSLFGAPPDEVEIGL